MRRRLEQIQQYRVLKQHFEANRTAYISAGLGLVAGIILTKRSSQVNVVVNVSG